ncbi:MAG: hypothetical protein ACFFG0_02585 [Candidatus Thorarchaeota archaeon]
MEFKKNINGKIVLKDAKGKEVLFDFPVDARQALELVDEDGGQRYFLPEPEKSKKSKDDNLENKKPKGVKKPKDDNSEEDNK